MAISFEQSKKQLSGLAAAPMMMSEKPDVMNLRNAEPIAAYSGGTWERDIDYRWFDNYSDDKISYIDENKNITVDPSQVNISQEVNSQFIPFEMFQRYDGIDLSGMTISIHYIRSDGSHGESEPVNVEFNSELGKIRFVWLVDDKATFIPGNLKFEIHADGSIFDSSGTSYGYRWKSNSTNKFNITQSLCDGTNCDDDIVTTDDWVVQIVESVANKVGDKIADANLSKYATNESVDKKISQIPTPDVSGQISVHDKSYLSHSDIRQQIKNINIPTDISAFNNDAGYLSEIPEEYVTEDELASKGYITEHQSLEGLASEDFVKHHVSEEIGKIKIPEIDLSSYAKTEDIPTLVSELENDAGYLTEHQSLEDYALKTEVYKQIGDLTDSEGNPRTVAQYVTDQMRTIDMSNQLGNLGTNPDGSKKTVEQYVDEKIVNVDLSEYATNDSLSSVEASLTLVSNNAVKNSEDISALQNNLNTIQSSLDSLEGDNKDLIIQYKEAGSTLTLYQRDENGNITITEGTEQVKVREISSTIITGTTGGSALVSKYKIFMGLDDDASSTILYGSPAMFNYTMSVVERKEAQNEDGDFISVYEEAAIPGDITLTLYKDNVYLTHFTTEKKTATIQKDSVDISDYISLGNQVFTIVASYTEKLGAGEESVDVRGTVTWAVNAVNLGINDLPGTTWETTPKYGSTTLSYTPIGSLEKTICFKMDNTDLPSVVTSLNGTSMVYTIPKQTHGVHVLQVWCEGNVGGTVIKTEPHKYVLMFVEDGNNTPIIRIKAPTTIEQYSSDYIYYNVFDPANAIIDLVTVYDEDGAVMSSKENITSAEQKLEFKPSVVKEKVITVEYGEYSSSVSIDVTKFPYDITAVSGDLMVDFVTTGRTNQDVDYNVFKNNAYTTELDSETGEEIKTEIPVTWEFSENFDWINGGWKADDNGDTYFCVKAGTWVDINYNLFGTDGVIARKDANGDYNIAGTGKEFKLVFKTTNVAQADATWLECMDIADKKSLGIKMEAQNAYIYSGLGTLEIPYVDNDIIEFDMNIIPMTEFLEDGQPNLSIKTIPMIITYEDGTPFQPKVINSPTSNFKQDTPQPITIGSEYCDVHLYRMKIYERYLDDKEVITNFIADARSGTEMARRFIKNDIYPVEDKNKITPESVAAACPDLKVYVLSAPHFTNDKKDEVANTTIRQIHNTGTREKPEYDASENWIATNATHNGQGTSSNEYGYSGRNLEFNLKKATITLNDNVTVVKEIQLSPTSYPTNYLNFKINIASSENANNALLQKRYDRYLPYTSLASLIDDRKKNSMEFFNCVVFIQETDPVIANHREFGDTNIHFYGIGNIGDSKKTDGTRVNDPDDVNEFCVEIMDWNRYLSSFPADTMVSTLYTDINANGDEIQVLRFEDYLIDENLGEDGILFEKDASGNYYHSTDTTVDKTKMYYIDVLENDKFDDEFTYEFRYIQNEWGKDVADYKEKNEAFQRPLRQKWIEFYRFVTRDLTTNGKEDAAKVNAWKSEFPNWFILDAALYYHLYTLRYTMVDNRAKNSFWHWGKHYLTYEEAKAKGISMYDEDGNLISDETNLPSVFYDAKGNEIKNINAEAAIINNGYRMDFWMYDNDTSLGIDNAGKLEIPFGVEEEDVDHANVPYFRANDSLVFERIAKYFAEELEDAWHATEQNPIGKVFSSTSLINEFDAWQDQFPEELWRLDYERKYKRTYVGGTSDEWDNALPQSNTSNIDSSRFMTEMMNGRKKYQRRYFERNQEIYMSSKFKGEVNIDDVITLRGTGRPTGKVVPPNFTLNIVPFSKMYVNLYNSTDSIYYHEKRDAGVPTGPIPYPGSSLDFIYVRGASQIQSMGDLSPMYLKTAELTPGAKMKSITLGNATDGYSNDSLETLQIGSGNKLLEELDIRNLSNLNNTRLPVSDIPSLKRVYAQGSNISEVSFANNGLIEEAYLPGTITRLELKNLHYIKTVELESYDSLLHLTVVDCSEAMNNLTLEMINKAPDLTTLKATNIDWRFEDATLLNRLYALIKMPVTQTSQEVVISGKVHVLNIREREYKFFKEVWPDLEITYNNMLEQIAVTYKNYDGKLLYTQYVDKGGKAFDPVEAGLIDIPTRESTQSTSFSYIGWDTSFDGIIMSPKTFTAVYSESIRQYTIKYVIDIGETYIEKQSSVGYYGDYIDYVGETPTYTKEESLYKFYLFNGWDLSGYVDGDKIIRAQFTDFTYTDTALKDVSLENMRPVELYALSQIGLQNTTANINNLNKWNVRLGHDVNFTDLEEGVKMHTIISEKTVFDGTKYIDTGLDLFAEDRDFVFAIDYEFVDGITPGGILAQCFKTSTLSGFRLWYNNSTQLNWGSSTTSKNPGALNKRDMLVLRHKAGEDVLHVYMSNLNEMGTIHIEDLYTTRSITNNSTLVLGCSKADDGVYESFGVGNIYWCKVWYMDFGDAICRKLANWTHNDMSFEVCGKRRFSLSDNSDRMSMISLLATHALDRTRWWNKSRTTTGGWASSALNEFLNVRLYPAFPEQVQAIMKRMKVLSSIGDGSNEISESDCYITLPALIELTSTRLPPSYINPADEPYASEMSVTTGKTISYMTLNSDRIRCLPDGTAVEYYTRSPNASYSTYIHTINTSGTIEDTKYAYSSSGNGYGVVIEISF